MRIFSAHPSLTRLGLVVTAVAAVAASRPAFDPIRLVTAPTGNEVRYRVREQLANFEFPNEAVGRTSEVRGGLSIDENGKVVPAESRFEVNLTALTSDQNMRDNYLRRRTLQVDQHPGAALVVTDLPGLPWPLPSAGSFRFTLVGDFTFKGVTRPTTWNVAAEATNGAYKGTAATAFTFETFELAKPRVARVLSVTDTIKLEYDFHLVPAP